MEGARPAVDFREVMVWREDAREGRVVRELEAGLRADEVINLQFTRCVWGTAQVGLEKFNECAAEPLGLRKLFL